ncbi:MAG: DoxX family protein [Gemmatimonadota bacterium]
MNGAAMSRTAVITSWIFQLAAAVILAQTLFFKFTGAEESRYIFSQLGIEPWGRIGTGFLELIAVVLLLYPRTPAIGAVLAIGLMCGAIVGHLTRLGVVVQNDGGLLFGLAVATLVSAVLVVLIRRRELPVVGGMF